MTGGWKRDMIEMPFKARLDFDYRGCQEHFQLAVSLFIPHTNFAPSVEKRRLEDLA